MNTARNKWFTAGILLLVATNIVLLTLFFMRPGRDGRHGPGPEKDPHLFLETELGLNDQQKTQYRELRKSQRTVIDSLNHAMHGLRSALFEFSTTNAAAADSISRKIGEIHGQIDQSTYTMFSKVRTICTAEQQKKFDAVIQEMLRRLGRRAPH
ncbi:MAG: hypothetical protein FD123_1303 [Bacteroidetes bacterium]|nr:MAG: hypothetical protein FD123_1303 [Bacteroidota bacterium]